MESRRNISFERNNFNTLQTLHLYLPSCYQSKNSPLFYTTEFLCNYLTQRCARLIDSNNADKCLLPAYAAATISSSNFCKTTIDLSIKNLQNINREFKKLCTKKFFLLLLYSSFYTLFALYVLNPSKQSKHTFEIHKTLKRIDAKLKDSLACMDNTILKNYIYSFIYFLESTSNDFTLKKNVFLLSHAI